MSLRLEGDVVLIEGHGRVEDAETLVGFAQGQNRVVLDLSACESLHGAVVQAILAFECVVVGQPTDAFLRDLLAPALARNVKVAL
uniref:hypothetical protein n=1 Tax=uncultured Caulobacter sp. TaxID=158749 RepID=UPI002601209D|nr:hypothetical protein [uncultured Caulobacter sp.]